jgi:hypothetical protein
MNGHRQYYGLDHARERFPLVDRQGYQHKTRLTGPLLPKQEPSWLARIMGRV